MMSLGVDTGGTFTDFVLLDHGAAQGALTIHKVLSTPNAPEQAIIQGITEMGLLEAATSGQLRITHGSTVATNAALEGKGVKTAFITNEGFADLLTIGRQARPELYNLQPAPILPPVAKQLCFESGGRLNAQGEEISRLTSTEITSLIAALKAQKPKAVAICHLFSYLNPNNEKILEEALAPHFYVSRSSTVLPTAGEYERGIATWLNASLGPLVKHYIDRLLHALSPANIAVMQSTGGTIDAKQAGDHAVNMLLSGPAGGLSGARFMGQESHINNLLTFDMGGTSTDVATIQGHIRLTTEGSIGPWPAAIPQVDMHTIGAGGGSIAFIDAGGLLQVGPESAGAHPGPACYGKGGQQPTVTDANAVLGRLRPELFLGGDMTLDVDASRKVLKPLADVLKLSVVETAQGIIDIANEHMVSALRVISVQRGHNIQQFYLCSFGGAGGLHVCALADALQMKQAFIPMHGGVLSAFGMLTSVKERQLSQSLLTLLQEDRLIPITQTINHCFKQLETRGKEELTQEGVENNAISISRSVDLRYQGQSFFLNIAWEGTITEILEAFQQQHADRYGHRLHITIELVNVRVALTGQQPPIQLPNLTTTQHAEPIANIRMEAVQGSTQPLCAIYQRDQLAPGQNLVGPALIAEKVSTTYINEGWGGTVDAVGNIILRKD